MQKHDNGIDQWGNDNGWRLKIKQPSNTPDIHPDSQKIRYSARNESGEYIDPTTGETGTRRELGHLNLDYDGGP